MNITRSLLFFIILLTTFGCKQKEVFVRNVEAIDDKSAYQKAIEEQSRFKNSIIPDAETFPVRAEVLGADSADDPAIWYNENDPSKSIVFGTNKQKGIHSYHLSGKELQYLDYAKINNIDIRQNVNIGNRKVDVLAGSNRSGKSIDFYIIDAHGQIKESPDYVASFKNYQPYGFCLHVAKSGQLFSFFNDKYGNVLQHLITVENDSLLATQVRKLRLTSQAEGMVADDENELLYIGEEQKGIHIIDTDPQAGEKTRILKGSTKENEAISFDIEGLALLPPHYLIASSQGNFSYAIFDVETEKYITSFTILDDRKIDGSEETDGLEIVRKPMGADYPEGILVTQDGFNTYGNSKENQNFKITNLQKVIDLITQD